LKSLQEIGIDYFKFKKDLRIETRDGKQWIYDPIRKKFLVMQAEEVVRQLLLNYLIQEKGYSPIHIKVEKGIKLNNTRKRYDILVYNKSIIPILLVECKAPGIPLNQTVVDQIARYNIVAKVPYLFLTNGQNNYCLKIDFEQKDYECLSEIPDYSTLIKESL